MAFLTKKATALSTLLFSAGSGAFTPITRFGFPIAQSSSITRSRPTTPLRVLPSSDLEQHEQQTATNEIDRLKSMAAKLRAEAEALEADKAQKMAQAAEKTFNKFDTNQDGEISLQELKVGLEKALKTDIPEERIQKLMENFDTNKDGVLQLEEFVSIETFRNQLENLTRQEKETAMLAAKIAQQETEAAKQVEAVFSAIKESINDRAPSNTDKILSILPYLVPLLDSLQFGQFLLAQNQDNPFVLGLALLSQLYRSVPFSGLIAFFALSILSNNLAINKLIRFNMKQAILLDVALFFPSLIGALGSLVAGGITGVQIMPPGIVELAQDAVFVTALLAISYSVVSSVLGVTPDKLPFISDAVSQRIPTIDNIKIISRLPEEKDIVLPRQQPEEKEEEEKDDEENGTS